MDRHAHSHRPTLRTRLGRGWPVTLLVVCLSMLAATAPASAQRGGRPRHDSACQMHAQGGCTPSCGYEHRGPRARKKFDRGWQAGRKDGRLEGYYDGLYGQRFSTRPPYRVRRHNRHYVDGYLAGFAKGYRKAYRKGQQDCRYGRPSRRWRRR